MMRRDHQPVSSHAAMGTPRFEQVPGKQEEQGAVARKDDRGVLVGGERAAGAQQDVGPAAP